MSESILDALDSVDKSTAPPAARQSTSITDALDSVEKAHAKEAETPKRPSYERAPTQPKRMAANPFEMVPQVIASNLTGAGSAILGGFTGVGEAIGQHLADIKETGFGAYSPKNLRHAAEQAGGAATEFQEDHTWKATTPQAQTAIDLANLPGRVVGTVAEYAGDKTAQVAGPYAGAAVKTAVTALPGVVVNKAMGRAAPTAKVPRPGIDPSSPINVAEPAPAAPATAAPAETVPAGNAPAAPVAPELTIQPQRGVTPNTAEVLPASSAPVAPVSQELTIPRENPPMREAPITTAEAAANEAALRKVGIENIRKSAVEENHKEASSQYITAKSSQEPYSAGMTDQINHEKGALENHFGNIEQAAGGTVVRYGTPEQVTDQIKTGQTIKQALQEGHEAWLKEGHDLYDKANLEKGGQPLQLPTLDDYLKRNENFVYDTENSLRNGVKGYMSRAGLLDPDGTVRPMTVQDAEGVRQYINSKFHPETKTVAKDMKNAIDNDVFKNVGGSTYEAARAHWKKGIDTYENPKAMGDLLSDQGVNQKIADELVLPKIAGLPQSQFDHIVNTMRADGKQSAINQIQTSLVNQIHRAGQSAINEPWNAVAAAKEASALSAKLKTAFADNPPLLQKVYDGIQAGNIIHIPTRYPGAAVQTSLLKKNFVENAISKGALGAGAALGSLAGPVGGSVGGLVGEHFGTQGAASARMLRQQKQLEAEIKYTRLSDLMQPRPTGIPSLNYGAKRE